MEFLLENLKNAFLEYQKYLAEREVVLENAKKEEEILKRRHLEATKSLNEEYDLLTSKLKEENQSKLNIIEEKYRNLIHFKEELTINIMKNSSFWAYKIGKAIAALISAFEGKEYNYLEGYLVISFIDYDECYADAVDATYRAGLITTSNNFYLKNGVVLYPSDNITDHVNEGDILLYCFSKPIKKIELYDRNGKFLLDEKYPYVKDFIDILITKRMDNKDFDIDEELNNFISENEQKLKRIKK